MAMLFSSGKDCLQLLFITVAFFCFSISFQLTIAINFTIICKNNLQVLFCGRLGSLRDISSYYNVSLEKKHQFQNRPTQEIFTLYENSLLFDTILLHYPLPSRARAF
jgi:hypothetical protein